MTRPDSPLHQHLLTRSDLARMAVPAAQILTWLAAGALDQVGALGDERAGDPVFTVTDTRLRADLLPRLLAIGKPAVVLTPLRVRSFLLRAGLALGATTPIVEQVQPASDGTALVEEIGPTMAMAIAEPAVPTPISEAPELAPEPVAPVTFTDTDLAQLDGADLATVLQSVAAEIEADVEVMLKLAEEEVQLEAEAARLVHEAEEREAGVAEPAFASTFEPAAELDQAGGGEFDDQGNDDQGQVCFDIDDLAGELGLTPAAPAAAEASEPSAEIDAQPEIDAEPIATDATPAPTAAIESSLEASMSFDAHGDSIAATDVIEPPAATPTPAPAAAFADEPLAPAVAPEHSEPTFETTMASAVDPLSFLGDTAAEPEPTATTFGEPDPFVEPVAATTATTIVAEEAASEPAPVSIRDALDSVLADFEPMKPAAEPSPTEPIAVAAEVAQPIAPPPAATEAEPAPAAAAPAAPQQAMPIDDPIPAAALAASTETMQRVEGFLGELKEALVELAHRPTPPPVDVAPLVTAVQIGFERTAERTAATNDAIGALSERIGTLGQHVEHGVQTVQAAVVSMANREAPVTPVPPARVETQPAPTFITQRSDRTPIVMLSLAALVLAWSVLFWFKTGSPRLALGTLVAANLVGCCMLASWRQR